MPRHVRKNFLIERPVRRGGTAAVDPVSSPDQPENVSTLSHELRTPLTSMKSCLNVVLSGDAGPLSSEQERFLGLTMRNIDRLDRLVGDLLAPAGGEHPDSGRRPCDLGAILQQTLAPHEIMAQQAAVQWDASGVPPHLEAEVNPDRIEQIVANLVTNAIKYTPAGGTVRVLLRPYGDPDVAVAETAAQRLAGALALPLSVVELVVVDTGLGMDPAERSRVFEPWFRGRGTADVAGTGLGMHITRGLVEAQGGDLRLDSEQGQGTSVSVRLPLDADSEQLVRGARRLEVLVGRWWTREIAVMDGRTQRGTRRLVDEFWALSAGAAERVLVPLAPGVVATVVPFSRVWTADWNRFWRGRSRQEQVPQWGFLPASVVQSINSQPQQC